MLTSFYKISKCCNLNYWKNKFVEKKVLESAIKPFDSTFMLNYFTSSVIDYRILSSRILRIIL